MSTASVNNLANTELQSIFNNALQNASATANNGAKTGSASSTGSQTDNSQLSPLAQLLSTLQQIQLSNPTEYQQLTQQIATNLQGAAQTAQTGGNTTEANQLNQLATDFSSASTSGQLPNIDDLAQAAGGHHHHHHHSESVSAGSNNDADSTSGTPSQLFSSVQQSGTQNNALNPMSIILNTLSSAGIDVSNA
jgi:hypothetical protein